MWNKPSSVAASHPRRWFGGAPSGVAPGLAVSYLSLTVLLPVAALFWQAQRAGWPSFARAIQSPESVAAIKLTLGAAIAVVAINAIFGTIVAWVLVRDDMPGTPILNALVDLPFALPTIVAGLTLLTLYGPQSPIGLDITYTRVAVAMAMLFETLPFVVRSVQPVLLELERDVEEAAASLGATRFVVFRRIIIPSIMPAVLSGGALAFAKAVGEFGAVQLLSGNIPFHTEVASVNIFGLIESNDPTAAAALSLLLLSLSLGVLLAMGAAQRFGARHAG